MRAQQNTPAHILFLWGEYNTASQGVQCARPARTRATAYRAEKVGLSRPRHHSITNHPLCAQQCTPRSAAVASGPRRSAPAWYRMARRASHKALIGCENRSSPTGRERGASRRTTPSCWPGSRYPRPSCLHPRHVRMLSCASACYAACMIMKTSI